MKTATPCRGSSTGKSLINEKTYPYLVEIPVAAAGLEVPLNRQIMKFHESRHLQMRHGRRIWRGGENYYRWCFPNLTTALAFVEQFGGAFYNPEQIAVAGWGATKSREANYGAADDIRGWGPDCRDGAAWESARQSPAA